MLYVSVYYPGSERPGFGSPTSKNRKVLVVLGIQLIGNHMGIGDDLATIPYHKASSPIAYRGPLAVGLAGRICCAHTYNAGTDLVDYIWQAGGPSRGDQ